MAYHDEPADAFIDLGYANGWGEETPDIVKQCNHAVRSREISRCLTEYKCWECRYIYKVDSSD